MRGGATSRLKSKRDLCHVGNSFLPLYIEKSYGAKADETPDNGADGTEKKSGQECARHSGNRPEVGSAQQERRR